MKARVAAVLSALLAVHGYAFPARIQAASPIPAMARTLLDYQSFMRGDRDGGVRFAITASREMQGTPLAELAVRLALIYEASSLAAVNVGEAEARRILDAESELAPEFRDVLRRFVARSLAAGGHREEALALHGRRGLAMSWLVAGPFYGSLNAGFASREFPEAGDVIAGDVVENPPGPALFAEWRRRPPWRPLHVNRAFPFVRPWRWPEREEGGAMLMFTGLSIESPDNRASFYLLSDTSWKLYVDGQLVAEVDKKAAEVPKEHVIPYPLSAGAHSLAIHLFPPSPGMSADAARVALRLESSSPFSWDRDAARPEWFKPGSARREARRLKYLEDLRAAMDTDPMLMAAYALACLEQGMRDAAAWWMERAARAEPANANLKALAGSMVSVNPLLPPERRGDLAIAWHQAALETKPDIVPSLIFLAEAAADNGQGQEAWLHLAKARSVNQASMEVMLAMGGWANKFSSGAAGRSIWDECSRLFPDSPAVQMAVASMPGEGFLDMDRRLAACRAAVKAGPYDFQASIRLAGALADSGNSLEAGYVLRDATGLFAGDAASLRDISEIYVRMSMFREAVEAMAGAVRLAPENPDLWRKLGDIHMESGDADKARKFWNASLAADSGQFDLMDMLDYLAGKPDPFREGSGYDAIAMTAEANVERLPGNVARLLDRSEIIFAADGSLRRITHEIDLARNRQGGELLAAIG
ncbi:MAG: hypothetical protein LBV15_01325, partial [Planctomycetota bacterium]|nr:hypothetical protein [Planctomycetota bacterium]